MTPQQLAVKFHETYERLAPQFGYETRQETRAFDPTTPNGQLMIAVCGELMEIMGMGVELTERIATDAMHIAYLDAEIEFLKGEIETLKERNDEWESLDKRTQAKYEELRQTYENLNAYSMRLADEKRLASERWHLCEAREGNLRADVEELQLKWEKREGDWMHEVHNTIEANKKLLENYEQTRVKLVALTEAAQAYLEFSETELYCANIGLEKKHTELSDALTLTLAIMGA